MTNSLQRMRLKDSRLIRKIAASPVASELEAYFNPMFGSLRRCA